MRKEATIVISYDEDMLDYNGTTLHEEVQGWLSDSGIVVKDITTVIPE